MDQIGQSGVVVAPHWYIRHGAIDRDTSFPIPLNLALKLQKEGKNVNYLLAWNRPHSGDYSLDELFSWIIIREYYKIKIISPGVSVKRKPILSYSWRFYIYQTFLSIIFFYCWERRYNYN